VTWRSGDWVNSIYGVAVLFLHHPPKNTQNARGRGSSALYYAADTELSAALMGKEQSNGVKLVEFKVVKQKDDAKVSFTLVNRIVPVLDDAGRPLAYKSGRSITSCVLDEASDMDTRRASAAEEVKLQIITYVTAHPQCSKLAAWQSVGGNKSKFLGYLQELVDAERLLLLKGRLSAVQLFDVG
jgi:hypothetical protein